MGTDPQNKAGREGRMAALAIAGTGLFWVGVTWAGAQFGWENRTRALMDLVAMAGFAYALIVTYRLWRARRNDEDEG